MDDKPKAPKPPIPGLGSDFRNWHKSTWRHFRAGARKHAYGGMRNRWKKKRK